MTILITGGYGFIGTNFINSFRKKNNELIINVDNLSFYKKKLNNYKKNRIHFYPYDITDYNKMKYIFQKYKPTTLINFAAQTHVDNSIDSSNDFVKSNIYGVNNLLNLSLTAFKTYSDFLFFQISTDEVFGSIELISKKKFSEKSSISPNNPYAATKAGSEHLVMSFNKTYGLPIQITNCSNNYGRYQHPEKLIPKTISRILQNQNIPVYGTGRNMREWLHVSDHCDAIYKILKYKNKRNTGRICIGSKNLVSNNYIVTELCNIADEYFNYSKKNTTKKLISYVDDRLGHDQKYSINSKLLKTRYKWKEKIKLKEGLKDTFLWYLNNKTWISNLKKTY